LYQVQSTPGAGSRDFKVGIHSYGRLGLFRGEDERAREKTTAARLLDVIRRDAVI